jgi:5-methylcytosine-specific restriction endonuclease McrA
LKEQDELKLLHEQEAEMRQARKCQLSKQEKAKLQRNQEKRNFFNRFVLKIIEDHYKYKIYEQFHFSCYNCGDTEDLDLSRRKPWKLCLDHHVPMINGGHYELGNLVVLCRRCNSIKNKKSPEEFYEKLKLDELERVLNEQKNICLDFVFDWGFWGRDRAGYLSSLGIDRKLIDEAMTNELHPYYIEPFPEEQNYSVVITVDISQLIKG